MSRKKMLIIDGNSLLHRAFYAIPFLSTSGGLPTNAVYGFTNMLFKVLEEEKPNYIAIAFDKGKITFRNRMYKDYKAKRKATPEELRPQFAMLKKILAAMRIPTYEIEGFEADDIIGTIAARAEGAGLKNIILTGDKDSLQLVSPQTLALITKKGISELEIFDVDTVKKEFKVSPEQFADYKGLMGDQSDNIPGVPGIGKKYASKLIEEYGSVEEVIKNADHLTPRLKKTITTNSELAVLSKKLSQIVRDVPIEIDLDKCKWNGPNYDDLLNVFNEFEFKRLINTILDSKSTVAGEETSKEEFDVPYKRLATPEEYNDLALAAEKLGQVGLVLANNEKGELIGSYISLGEGKVFELPLNQNETKDDCLLCLKEICEHEEIEKCIHNAKDAILLLNKYNIQLNNLSFDTMLAAYLLNPAFAHTDLSNLALEHLGIAIHKNSDKYLASCADVTLRLAKVLDDKLKEQEQESLYYKMELPLVSVLADMEIAGVAVDKTQLKTMSVELEKQIEGIQANIFSLAGETFNVNSPKQLSVILFEKLKLPVIKKTKTGYSTDAAVLEKLANEHEIIEIILQYRQIVKLKSTYVDGLKALINPRTGRLHSTFHQTVTATGRLSSAEPNLQNIPIRLEQGRKIRKFFMPRHKQNLILTADYSQIELRVLAHISGDPNLIEAFAKGQDIHSRTAAEVFNIPMEEVTPELRNRAKAVNFGIVYGISDFGLARDLRITRKEAKSYIENYFRRYKGVKQYQESIVQKTLEKGYVTTLFKRRRYIPDLFSSNYVVRNAGKRTAINTPIQGTAADIIKIAMVNINNRIRERKMKSIMILQVHDELIFDIPSSELDDMLELVKTSMENAVILDVPLTVETKVGKSWYDTKKV